MEGMQPADQQDSVLTINQLRSALHAEKENSRKRGQELQATRTKLCEEIGRSNRMYKKVEMLEDSVDDLTRQVEFYKGQMLRLQFTKHF